MGAFRDFRDSFKGALTPGPTDPGHWRNHERFGRLTGTGEVAGEVELPEGKISIGIEDHITVTDLEFELTGPDGQAVALNRNDNHDGDERAMHNLDRIAEGEIAVPGMHRLRVRAPEPKEELVVTAGRDLTTWEAIRGTFAGPKGFGRV